VPTCPSTLTIFRLESHCLPANGNDGEVKASRPSPTACDSSTRFSSRLQMGLKDFTPFFPLEGIVRLIDHWARDGLLLIGDSAHTMSPMGAIGVNVAIATAAVAAQELYPRLGQQRVLLGQQGSGSLVGSLVQKLFPILVRSPLLPRIQFRIFFGAPLPPLDPAFSFRTSAV
jgi:FAD binding domain